jgi:cytoskeletal protein CcmA (bactofilin family)
MFKARRSQTREVSSPPKGAREPQNENIVNPGRPVTMPDPLPLQRDTVTFIAADVTIRGLVSTENSLDVHARVEGDIYATSLHLGEQALVLGSIFGETVSISGRVEGDIRARSIELGPDANVRGTLNYEERISIASGASFEGECRKASFIRSSEDGGLGIAAE